MRRRPYAVVLFDETEKAHGDVFNVLLQILDDGRVTDSQGRVVSFRNAIVILTSNIGSTYVLDEQAGGDAARERVMQAVRAHFRPEFVNRIDEFIVFHPLREKQIERIVRLQVARVCQRLTGRKISLRLTDAAIQHLAEVGYDPVYGARPVKRAIQHSLETMLAQAILRGDINDEDSVTVDVAADAQPPRLVLSKVCSPRRYSHCRVLTLARRVRSLLPDRTCGQRPGTGQGGGGCRTAGVRPLIDSTRRNTHTGNTHRHTA